MGVLRAYFDESERKDVGIFAVSACLFSDEQAVVLEHDWSALFQAYGDCHMKDLGPGTGTFKDIPARERDDLVKHAVTLLIDHIEFGAGAVCNARDWLAAPVPMFQTMKSPYALCCRAGIVMLDVWLTANNRDDLIEYVFEDGYTDASEHARHMDRIEFLGLTKSYRYRSHAFVSKSGSTLLQAADLLAWEVGRYYWQPDTRPMRGSLKAMIDSGKFDIFPLVWKDLAAQSLAMAVGVQQVIDDV